MTQPPEAPLGPQIPPAQEGTAGPSAPVEGREAQGAWFWQQDRRQTTPPPPYTGSFPYRAPPPQPRNASEDGGARPFFSPNRPVPTGAPARPAGSHAAPPPYQGELKPPAPYTGVPGGPAAYANGASERSSQPPELEPPDRVPFQAPPQRRSSLIYLYVGVALLSVVLGVMAISQFTNRNPRGTAVVSISERGSTYAGDALIVRNESVFSQEGVSAIKYSAVESAAVARGEPVCVVYTFGFNSKELTTLQTYRRQIKDYLKILEESSNALDTRLQRLETSVLERALETQALVRGAQGNLINQETQLKEAMEARYQYLKQKYPDDTKLTRLFDNENNQLQRIETWTKQYAATDNGIISFYTDGLEGALNTNNFAAYAPTDVRAMIGGQVPEAFRKSKNSMDIYRLVRQYDWAVLMLTDDLSWNPVVGEEYQMLIESFDSTTVRATVESVTRSGGDLLIRLRVSSEVDPVLYVRHCRVQLSASTITYSVPSSALIEQDGMLGVVVSFREGDFLVPVVVVSQDATQAHVVPVNRGYLYEGLSVRLF